MRLRALLVATVLALGVGGVAAAPASGDAESHAGRPLATAPRADGGLDLRFVSVGVSGEPVEQTAVLWLPDGPRSGHVVGWGHPTTGLADRCAPSATPDSYVPGLGLLLEAGHVVVAPDYEGLGASGHHPYLVGDSAGRSMLDALRAARAVTDADGRTAVFGWSQGGHAALFAARLAPEYAPELDLAGAAAISPVTDVAGLLDPDAPFAEHPGFVAMLAAGYAAAYDDLDTTQVLPDAARAVAVARDRCSLGAVAALHETPLGAPGDRWTRRLAENDPTADGLDVPVLVTHGERDRLLPVEDAITAYRRLCALGTTVRLERIAEATHGTSPFLATGTVVEWLDARLDGDRLTGCAMRRS